jgi:hypothetical protein
MPTTDEFRSEIRAQISRAEKQGRPHAEINSGELHRLLGGYPGSHQMPTCCAAMRREMTSLDSEVFAPSEGNGASLTIRYLLPRGT